LDEDRVLNLSKRRLLNPNFAVEDLADDVTLLVLGHPGRVFIAVARSQAIERTLVQRVIRRSFVVVIEKFPWPEMSVMHAMQDLQCQLNVTSKSPTQLTTHMPFQAANRVAMPMKRPRNANALQPRLAELRVITMA